MTTDQSGSGGLQSVEKVVGLEHAVVTNAVAAVDSLIRVVEAGAQFIPQEVAALSTDLLKALKSARADIESVGGGGSTKAPTA